MAIVNEVVTKFSFKGSLKPQKAFNQNLGSSIKLLRNFGVATIGTAGIIAGWAAKTMQGRNSLIQLGAETNMAIGRIQELGHIASVSGSSAGAMQSTLAGLTKTIGDASRGAGTGASEFARLGISVRDSNGRIKNAGVVIDEVRQRFNALNLDMSQRTSMAAALGIDKSLVQTLSRTDSEMAALSRTARELGTLTQEDATKMRNFNDSVTTLRFGFSSLQDRIAIGLAPQLESLSKGFTDFLIVSKDVISNGIVKLFEAVGVLRQAFVRLFPVILGGLAIWIALNAKLVASWVLLNATMLLNPVFLITAGIAAMLVVIDDLIVGLQGGKSVVADFFQAFLGFDIIAPLRKFIDYFKNFFIPQAKKLIMSIPGIGLFIKKDGGAEPVPSGSAATTSAAAGNITTSSSSVDQNNTFNITSSDPVRVGQVINDTLQQQLNDTVRTLGVGGR